MLWLVVYHVNCVVTYRESLSENIEACVANSNVEIFS